MHPPPRVPSPLSPSPSPPPILPSPQPHSPPPRPPALPAWCHKTCPGETAQSINARYRQALPSSDLAKAGVLLTLFNNPQAWQMCSATNDACRHTRDRRSATLIYYRPRGTTAQPERQIYLHTMGGMIIAPSNAWVLCGYPEDGRTRGKMCPGAPKPNQGNRKQCLPGCMEHPDGRTAERWCEPQKRPRDGGGKGWCDGHPWRQRDFAKMLELQRADRWAGYNEIVIDNYLFSEGLPYSIDAFFWLDDPQCNSACKAVTRRAHQLFLERYPEHPVPLLAFKPGESEAPFW